MSSTSGRAQRASGHTRRATGALIALATLACRHEVAAPPPPPPSHSFVVTVAATPTQAMPGQTVAATISASPPGQEWLDSVVITVRGVLTAAETVPYGLPGAFTATRRYTLRADTLGALKVSAVAWARRLSDSATAQVSVADTVNPVIQSFSLAPPGSMLEPGDSLAVAFGAFDPIGLRYAVVRVTGAVTFTDSVAGGAGPSVQVTTGVRLPATLADGQTIRVSALAVDPIGHSVVGALPAVLIDKLPPAVAASVLNAQGTTAYAPGDTVHLALHASDEFGLARVGYRIQGPVVVLDSFAVTSSAFDTTVRIPVTVAWTGTAIADAFALGTSGHRTDAVVGTITVVSRTAQPVVSAALLSTVADVAFDDKRGVVYVSEPGSNVVGVLNTASATWGTPLGFADQPRGLDLSLGGDTLFVAGGQSDFVHVVNLVSGARDTLRVSNDTTLALEPERLRAMANGMLLVSFASPCSWYCGRLLTVDVANRAVQDLGAALQSVWLSRSGDRTRALISSYGSSTIYDAVTDTLRDLGTGIAYGGTVTSADFTGARYLVDNILLDSTLTRDTAVQVPGYQTGTPSVLTQDGTQGFFATAVGFERIRLSDGGVLANYALPAVPYFMALSPDGLTLVVAAGSSIYVVDLW